MPQYPPNKDNRALVQALLGLKAYQTPDPRHTIWPETSAGVGAERSLEAGDTPGTVVKNFVGQRGDINLPNQSSRDPRLGPPTNPFDILLEQMRGVMKKYPGGYANEGTER